jgi:hypothetical protein
MAGAEKSEPDKRFSLINWRCNYKLFLVVFCYAALFLGMPGKTFQLNSHSIERQFGVTGNHLRVASVVEGLSTFILAPFIVILGRTQRRPFCIGVALLCTGVSHLLVFLAHLLTNTAAYVVENSVPQTGRLTCDLANLDHLNRDYDSGNWGTTSNVSIFPRFFVYLLVKDFTTNLLVVSTFIAQKRLNKTTFLGWRHKLVPLGCDGARLQRGGECAVLLLGNLLP